MYKIIDTDREVVLLINNVVKTPARYLGALKCTPKKLVWAVYEEGEENTLATYEDGQLVNNISPYHLRIINVEEFKQ